VSPALIAGLAEAKLIANYWPRAGNKACVNGAAEFLHQTVQCRGMRKANKGGLLCSLI
jgi:ABC-type sugar transport system substrate-binding protein